MENSFMKKKASSKLKNTSRIRDQRAQESSHQSRQSILESKRNVGTKEEEVKLIEFLQQEKNTLNEQRIKEKSEQERNDPTKNLKKMRIEDNKQEKKIEISDTIKFCYGDQKFSKFTQKNRFYIDRTDFIAKLEEQGDVLIFLRPRRFGKSVTLSMLQHYYEKNYEEQFDNIFENCFIKKNPTPLKNKFLTMTLRFSSMYIDGTLAEFNESFLGLLKVAIYSFIRKNSEKLHWDNNVISKIQSMNELDGFRLLTTLIMENKEYNERFYLFIDEYDTSMNQLLSKTSSEIYQDMVTNQEKINLGTLKQNSFRRFFSVLKDQMADGMGKIYITGVSSIALNTFTSGFNVAQDISYNLKFAHMCGLTGKEIQIFLERYIKNEEEIKNIMDIMIKHYDGYRFHIEQNENIFNPTLVTYFLQLYFAERKIPKQLFDQNVKLSEVILQMLSKSKSHKIDEITSDLIKNNFIRISAFRQNFKIEDVSKLNSNHDYIASYMFQHGALTHSTHSTEESLCFTIPNLEMRFEFIEKLIEILKIDDDTFKELINSVKMLEKGKIFDLGNLVKKIYLSKLRAEDTKHSYEQDLKSSFLILINLCAKSMQLSIKNEFDFMEYINKKEIWGQTDSFLLNKNVHMEFKNIRMTELQYENQGIKAKCGSNQFEYLTLLAEQIEKEEETAVMRLKMVQDSIQYKTGLPTVGHVWKNLIAQTRENKRKIQTKLGKKPKDIKSFAILRIGLYRLKMELVGN